MLQDILISAAAAATAANPAASNAESLQKLGFSHMIQNLDIVSAGVLFFLVIMSVGAWWYTIVNLIKNLVVRSRADRVIRTFWETPNAQDAIRFMEEQPRERAVLEDRARRAQAAAHHQRHEGSRLVESLNRSEFVDRALRQAVTRESVQPRERPDRARHRRRDRAVRRPARYRVGHLPRPDPIGATGQASIDAVAGPVGEALIMTAHRSVRRDPGGAGLQLLRAHEPRHQRQVRYLRARPARLLRHRFARRRSRSAKSAQICNGARAMAFSSGGSDAAARWPTSTSRPSWT